MTFGPHATQVSARKSCKLLPGCLCEGVCVCEHACSFLTPSHHPGHPALDKASIEIWHQVSTQFSLGVSAHCLHFVLCRDLSTNAAPSLAGSSAREMVLEALCRAGQGRFPDDTRPLPGSITALAVSSLPPRGWRTEALHLQTAI